MYSHLEAFIISIIIIPISQMEKKTEVHILIWGGHQSHMLRAAEENSGASKLLEYSPLQHTRMSAHDKTKVDRAKAQKAQIKICATTEKQANVQTTSSHSQQGLGALEYFQNSLLLLPPTLKGFQSLCN